MSDEIKPDAVELPAVIEGNLGSGAALLPAETVEKVAQHEAAVEELLAQINAEEAAAEVAVAATPAETPVSSALPPWCLP